MYLVDVIILQRMEWKNSQKRKKKIKLIREY